ncbi:MAG TPA: hypothetical protein PLU10_05840, partial [Chitinophagaceae bacterium]|nr:hypothetical protein [Chitinophagaceae bacterium]
MALTNFRFPSLTLWVMTVWVLMAACSSSSDMESNDKKDSKPLTSFQHIQSNIAADLNIWVDTTQQASYIMDCDESVQKKIKFEVRNKTLFIYVDSSLTTLNP